MPIRNVWKKFQTLQIQSWVFWWCAVAVLGAVGYVVMTIGFEPSRTVRVLSAVAGLFFIIFGGLIIWGAKGIRRVSTQ